MRHKTLLVMLLFVLVTGCVKHERTVTSNPTRNDYNKTTVQKTNVTKLWYDAIENYRETKSIELTQMSDVNYRVNGSLSYDKKITKTDYIAGKLVQVMDESNDKTIYTNEQEHNSAKNYYYFYDDEQLIKQPIESNDFNLASFLDLPIHHKIGNGFIRQYELNERPVVEFNGKITLEEYRYLTNNFLNGYLIKEQYTQLSDVEIKYKVMVDLETRTIYQIVWYLDDVLEEVLTINHPNDFVQDVYYRIDLRLTNYNQLNEMDYPLNQIIDDSERNQVNKTFVHTPSLTLNQSYSGRIDYNTDVDVVKINLEHTAIIQLNINSLHEVTYELITPQKTYTNEMLTSKQNILDLNKGEYYLLIKGIKPCDYQINIIE